MDALEVVAFFIGIVIGLIGGAAIAIIDDPVNDIRHQAIEREYGLYCPHDGKFAWKGECGEGE